MKRIVITLILLACLAGCKDANANEIPTKYQPAPTDVGDSLGNFYVPCVDNKGTSETYPCIWDAMTNESVDQGSHVRYIYTIFVTSGMMCPEVDSNVEQCIKLP